MSDDEYASRAVERIALLPDIDAFWLAVDNMLERRKRMDKAANDRISDALWARFAEINGGVALDGTRKEAA